LLTAKALKAVAVASKFLAAGIAVVTGHYEPCLSLAIGSQWSCKGSLRAIALSSTLPVVTSYRQGYLLSGGPEGADSGARRARFRS
jgi:hypothetical protein